MFVQINSDLSGGHLGMMTTRFRYFDEGFEKSSVSNTNLKRETGLMLTVNFLSCILEGNSL